VKAKPCPRCKTPTLAKRTLWRLLLGAALVFLSFLLFFPTVGVSFILGIYGVFLMVPRRECAQCGWHE
jgi:hypothetical protein